MAEIQHSQIRAKLQETIVPIINTADLKGQQGDQLEAHILSRAVAVAALKIAADVDNVIASGACVDGGDDNGIDSIYYDPQLKALFLVQSKWSAAHASSIGSADILKFLQGVQDLVSLKKDRFNNKVQKIWNVIEDALTKLTSVQMVVAYPGSSKIDDEIQKRIDDFVKGQNDTSELFYFQAITQRELFQYFVKEAAPPQIDLTIRLSHYGLVEEPLRAVYGQVSASDVAAWHKQYGNNLFAGNIRHFLGLKSEVNTAIAQTLVDEPRNFWYYNNGVTMIVEGLKRQPIGGSDRSVGIFDCQKVTIVNGAQTVGTIGRNLVDPNSPAFLQLRVIVIDDPESPLGKRITRASNTQNRIDARNFVALDPEQERIRTELLIDKVAYEYREGEPLDSVVDGFEFIEAITTLACASDEMSYVALAKGYVGGLYADIAAAPYKALFNAGTSSARIWYLVRLARKTDKIVKDSYDQNSPSERGIVVHGNRFLMHCVLRQLARKFNFAKLEEIPAGEVGSAVSRVLDGVRIAIDDSYPDAYLAPLFKNVKKCTEVRAKFESAVDLA